MCEFKITYKNWARHTMSKRHIIINDPNSMIVKKFNRTGPTVKELKEKCRENNIKGFSTKRKANLLDLLNKGQRKNVRPTSIFRKPKKINTIFPFHKDLIASSQKIDMLFTVLSLFSNQD